MKSSRQNKILELIAERDIETQEQLLSELMACGFHATQATISRDIKQLRIIKELGPNGTYRYQASAGPSEHALTSRLNNIYQQCVTSAECAQNLLVIKTMPGLAPAACSALDKMQLPEIIGTLAGDDTCFIIMKDSASASALCAEIKSQITH